MRLLLAVVVATFAVLAGAAAGLADASFTDPAGDSGGAPDITAVTVTNTPQGQVTFAITTNVTTFSADQVVFVVMETDNNTATGDRGGFDSILVADSEGWDFGKLSGDSVDYGVAATTASAAFQNGVLTFSINRSELGNPTTIVFYVESDLFSGDQVIASDAAPDGTAVWEYEVVLAPALALKAGKPIPVPGRPVAGKRFAVSVPITRTDTGGALTSGLVTCTATAGGKAIAATGRFAGGLARCAMTIPKAAKGKFVRGTVTVVFQGKQVKKSFAYKVI